MCPLEKKKLKLKSKKLSQQGLQPNSKERPQNQSHKRDNSTSTLHKSNGLKLQNQPLSKTHKSKTKTTSSFSTLKQDKTNQNKGLRKRLISQSQAKQHQARYTKSQQKKQPKYILNQIPSAKVRHSQTLKRRNLSLVSHNKSYSNQTLNKQLFGPKIDTSSFAKSSNTDFTKIKKKKHDYIKSFNKTSCFQKTLSNGFHSMGYDLSETLGIRHTDKTGMSLNEYNFEENKQNVTDKDLQKVKIKNCPKLADIRSNASNLFKKLKSPNKNKLQLISNGYEKIVTELYKVINKNSLPNCQISRIFTNSSHKQTHGEIGKNKKEIANLSIPSSDNSRQTVLQHDSTFVEQSQHQDSYLDYGPQKVGGPIINKPQNKKQSMMKKLNLQAIKKVDIKQYQDQFMDLKEQFSESWKREINEQKRF